MMTFISCAKTMAQEASRVVPFMTDPKYRDNAHELAERLATFSVEELMDILKVSPKIAEENMARYNAIIKEEAELMPALLAYTGVVFKHIAAENFSTEDLEYAQGHLRITSFLYGLLKPLDAISPYRLEGKANIDPFTGQSVFNYWKPKLTDNFIDEIRADGGTLINLASGEMKNLFDWKRLEKSVRVIQPEFLMKSKDSKVKTVTIYAKMCRGEMTRYILLNRIESPEELKAFEWDGFTYCPERSTGSRFVFLKEV